MIQVQRGFLEAAMKLVRGHLICIDDEYDRAVMLEEGLEIVQRKLGNFPNELLRDVVDATTPTQAQALIDRLYGRETCEELSTSSRAHCTHSGIQRLGRQQRPYRLRSPQRSDQKSPRFFF
jgi:hypothetical protein